MAEDKGPREIRGQGPCAGLIQLYAERKRRMGYAFAADTPWQAEFEDNFPYAETDDRLR